MLLWLGWGGWAAQVRALCTSACTTLQMHMHDPVWPVYARWLYMVAYHPISFLLFVSSTMPCVAKRFVFCLCVCVCVCVCVCICACTHVALVVLVQMLCVGTSRLPSGTLTYYVHVTRCCITEPPVCFTLPCTCLRSHTHFRNLRESRITWEACRSASRGCYSTSSPIPIKGKDFVHVPKIEKYIYIYIYIHIYIISYRVTLTIKYEVRVFFFSEWLH